MPIGKGKEKEPTLVKLRLKWPGRQSKVEAASLVTSPPGKMFKAGFTGISLSQEERDARKIRRSAPGQAELRHTSDTGTYGASNRTVHHHSRAAGSAASASSSVQGGGGSVSLNLG